MNDELITLEINKDLLPYYCDIVLGGELFTLHFAYNAAAELFTTDLYKGGELICAGEPIVYGVPLWADVYRPGTFPNVAIIPLDPSGEANAVTWDNLCETVLLVVTDWEVEENA